MSSFSHAVLSRVEDRIRASVEAGRVLGLSLAITRGSDLATAAFGETSLESDGVPVTPTTLFAVGSVSKVLLATLIMRLVERGALDLNRPVVAYLPGFSFGDPELGSRVTLRHLLSHTSGLPAAGKDWGPCGRDALRDFVYQQIPYYGFIAEPGRVYEYSNTAVCCAGHVAEAVTGDAYRDLVREHVLDPLGMSRTTYDHAVAMTYRLALPHEEDEHGTVCTVHRWADNASGDPSGFAIAPVVDLASLAAMLLRGGRHRGERYLSPESVELMQTPHADRRVSAASHPVAHWTEGYGLGLMLGTYRGTRLVQHGGTLQSCDSYFHLFPGAAHGGAGFVLLTNFGVDQASADLAFATADALLGLPASEPGDRAVLPAPLQEAPERERWPRYGGTYLSARLGRLATVRVHRGCLQLEQQGETRPLVPASIDRYFYEEEGGLRVPVEFLRQPDGRGAEHLFVGGNPYRRMLLDPAFQPDPSSWSRFEGAYRDPSNLGEGAVWHVAVEGGRLHLSGDWADEDCTPIGQTSFLSGIGLLEFDAAGTVLQVGRATRYLRIDGRSPLE